MFLLFLYGMVSKKVVIILNVALLLVIILLILPLFGVKIPSLGKALSTFDGAESECAGVFGEQVTDFSDLDQCCLYARKLGCHRENGSWICGRTDSAHLVLNAKAYNYCREQVIW